MDVGKDARPVQLLELCADYDEELGALIAEGAVLNEYMVAGRYSGDLTFEDIGEAQAEEALSAAQLMRARVTGWLA